MTEVSLRAARPEDGPSVATLHARSWQVAYRDILPAALLDRAMADLPERCVQRVEMIRNALGSETRHWVAEIQGSVVGWACSGPPRDDDLPAHAHELYAIYLQPEYVGLGVGRRLMQHVLTDVCARGHDELVMWVLVGNEVAQRFYRKAGFAPDARVAAQPFKDTGALKLRMWRRLAAGAGSAGGAGC